MLQYMRNVMRAKGEDGASAVEYGLLVAAIAALIVVIVFALGGIIRKVFSDTCKTIDNKVTSTTATCD
jgi:pilus assembly protein Flp/PilA